MSGRRSHPRYAVLPSPEGVLRVMRDVVVQSTTPEQLVVVARLPGVRGELVSLQSLNDAGETVLAQIVDSQPVIVDGSLRHRLHLRQLDGPAASEYECDERPFEE